MPNLGDGWVLVIVVGSVALVVGLIVAWIEG